MDEHKNMTTELDINRVANRLKAAFPGVHTAISFNLDSFSGGNQKVEWSAYVSETFTPNGISPFMPTLAELEDWLDANWLKEDKA
jgi:hypothetical protein